MSVCMYIIFKAALHLCLCLGDVLEVYIFSFISEISRERSNLEYSCFSLETKLEQYNLPYVLKNFTAKPATHFSLQCSEIISRPSGEKDYLILLLFSFRVNSQSRFDSLGVAQETASCGSPFPVDLQYLNAVHVG